MTTLDLRDLPVFHFDPRPEDSSWRDFAGCRDSDPDLFFPTRGESISGAEVICFGCPVRRECLIYATWEVPQKVGIFGGITPRKRAWLRTGRLSLEEVLNASADR